MLNIVLCNACFICGLVDYDFTNDEFIGHYPIRNGKGGEIGGAYDEFYKVPSTFLFLMY